MLAYRNLKERDAVVRIGRLKKAIMNEDDEDHQYVSVLGEEVSLPTGNRMLTYLQVVVR